MDTEFYKNVVLLCVGNAGFWGALILAIRYMTKKQDAHVFAMGEVMDSRLKLVEKANLEFKGIAAAHALRMERNEHSNEQLTLALTACQVAVQNADLKITDLDKENKLKMAIATKLLNERIDKQKAETEDVKEQIAEFGKVIFALRGEKKPQE